MNGRKRGSLVQKMPCRLRPTRSFDESRVGWTCHRILLTMTPNVPWRIAKSHPPTSVTENTPFCLHDPRVWWRRDKKRTSLATSAPVPGVQPSIQTINVVTPVSEGKCVRTFKLDEISTRRGWLTSESLWCRNYLIFFESLLISRSRARFQDDFPWCRWISRPHLALFLQRWAIHKTTIVLHAIS